ncbi:hypothetical protein HHI36_019837 [Cryptolaemus montrouzieri]|uniref:Uncharacterized protein n=1 Tax=Cryptolaemus montrouzieri TaxID=559131 RepID=A0ABD2N999_9CUCU
MITKGIPEGITVSNELKVHVENENSNNLSDHIINGDVIKNNPQVNYEIVRIKHDLEVVEIEAYYSRKLIKNLETMVSDKELIISLLNQNLKSYTSKVNNGIDSVAGSKKSATIRNSTNKINGSSEIVATAKISSGGPSKGLTQNKTNHTESKSIAKLNNKNHETINLISNDDHFPDSTIENKNMSDHGWSLVNNCRGNSKLKPLENRQIQQITRRVKNKDGQIQVH